MQHRKLTTAGRHARIPKPNSSCIKRQINGKGLGSQVSFLEISLMILAISTNGVLAGISVERSLVELPAWDRTNLHGFHEYAQQADLGTGIKFYPAIGITSAALVVAATVSGLVFGTSTYAALFLVISTIFSVLHSITTSRAAPNMLGLRESLSDTEVRHRFKEFKKWQDRRAVFQVLSFFMILIALGALAGVSPSV